jgi:hypothetical protein
VLVLAGATLGAISAGRAVRDRLLIATSWPPADRQRIESEFHDWVAASGSRGTSVPVRVDWLILAPWDDPARLPERSNPPDVLLGGPGSLFEGLASAGVLSPLQHAGSPSWLEAHRELIGPAGTTSPRERGALEEFDDPRHDFTSRAAAMNLLHAGSFLEGYARLVHQAGSSRRIGRFATGKTPSGIEGAAMLNLGRNHELGRLFLRFLAASGRAGSPPPRPIDRPSAGTESLLVDLVGATVVDAQDELWTATAALEGSTVREPALRWLTEPPPWPPASVARIMRRRGERAMAMVETLAGQLAPDPDVRAWLIRSWLSQPRTVDPLVLEELVRAVDGRLCREPRFRDWLRAEWTAWARQRYRRVARLAATSVALHEPATDAHVTTHISAWFGRGEALQRRASARSDLD